MEADVARAELAGSLVRVAAGDRAALQEVYRRTSGKLFAVCLRILKDRNEAEDVLQEIYINVWRKAGQFDADRASPITWLAAMARNRAIDRLRAAGRRQSRPIEDAAEVADDGLSALDQLSRSEDARRLDGCLAELEPTHEAAVRTAFFEGLTYDELSRRVGVPLGTMKGWIRRSLMKLKACLES